MDDIKEAEGAFNQGKLKNEQMEELKRLFRHALEDGRLSTKELTQIQFFYYDSELSEPDFSALKNSVFKQMVERAIADLQVTEQELTAIFRIAKQLNISPEWKAWAKEQMQEYSLPDDKFFADE